MIQTSTAQTFSGPGAGKELSHLPSAGACCHEVVCQRLARGRGCIRWGVMLKFMAEGLEVLGMHVRVVIYHRDDLGLAA